MKTKLLGFVGAASLAAFAFVATNADSRSGNTDLASLVSVNTANAECKSGGLGGGKCLTLSQICVGDPGNSQCDF